MTYNTRNGNNDTTESQKKKDVLMFMQEAKKLESPLYSKLKMYILGIRCVD